MKPAAFDYFRPASVSEALALLAKYKDDCKILAGGQSLVPAMNFRLARPAILIDINELAELDYVRAGEGGLHIGALTRHAVFHRHVVDSPLGALLSKVARHIAHYPIRQRGTFAGSLAHADPASEWCLVATTLDAAVVAKSARGERVIAVGDFFHGTFSTDLAADELLAEVLLPAMAQGWQTGFYEFSRRAGDFALGMALAALRIEAGLICEARLGIGGVSDRAIRPIADIHASPEYRRDLVAASVKRALAEAAA